MWLNLIHRRRNKSVVSLVFCLISVSCWFSFIYALFHGLSLYQSEHHSLVREQVRARGTDYNWGTETSFYKIACSPWCLKPPDLGLICPLGSSVQVLNNMRCDLPQKVRLVRAFIILLFSKNLLLKLDSTTVFLIEKLINYNGSENSVRHLGFITPPMC